MAGIEKRPPLRVADIATIGNLARWIIRRPVILQSESLGDYRPERNTGGARIVISSIEGARNLPTDFASEKELIDDLHRIMGNKPVID